MVIIYGGGGGRGGQVKIFVEKGGAIIYNSDYLSNPTSPPYPIKNKRSVSSVKICNTSFRFVSLLYYIVICFLPCVYCIVVSIVVSIIKKN